MQPISRRKFVAGIAGVGAALAGAASGGLAHSTQSGSEPAKPPAPDKIKAKNIVLALPKCETFFMTRTNVPLAANESTLFMTESIPRRSGDSTLRPSGA
ncbi:MAG: hypothetical protein JNM86_03270 [Phycisphaerae bacterium]|nr:hypothetical protein [Phycisphaerae bacterium]